MAWGRMSKMNCKEFNERLDNYIDETLSLEEKADFERHLKSCKRCQEDYRNIKDMVDILNSIEPEKLSEDFSEKVIKQIQTRKKENKMKRVLPYVAVFIIGIFVTSLLYKFPLSSFDMSSNTFLFGEAAMDSGAAQNSVAPQSGIANFEKSQSTMDEKVEESSEKSPTVVKDEVFDRDKILYQATLNLDVEDDNKTMEEITNYVKAKDGFIENFYRYNDDSSQSELYMSHSYVTIRIPAEKFNEVIDKLKEFGEETSTDISSTNVSTEYRDIKSEQESLQIQQDRLLDYLKKAEKIEDMLTIETELSRVRTDLNRINTQLNNYDRMINYSTITVNLRETGTLSTTVKSPFGKLLENIGKGFVQSINLLLQLIHFVIVLVARIIPFAVVILPVSWIVWKKRKR